MVLAHEMGGYQEAMTVCTKQQEARLGFEHCCDAVAHTMTADNMFFWHKCVLCSLSPRVCCGRLPIVISAFHTFVGLPKVLNMEYHWKVDEIVGGEYLACHHLVS